MPKAIYRILFWSLLSHEAVTAKEFFDDTQVTIRRPEGFAVNAGASRFLHEGSGSSVVVVRFDASYEKAKASFSEEALEARGEELQVRGDRKMGGFAGEFIRSSRVLANTNRKLVEFSWVFGDEEDSVLVTGTFPEELSETVGKRVESAVCTASWLPAVKEELRQKLGFEVEGAGDLLIAERLAKSVFLTKEGELKREASSDPVVAFSHVEPADWETPEDLAAFVQERFEEDAALSLVGSAVVEEVEADGLSGVRLEATAERDGEQCYVFRVVLPDESGFFEMTGMVGAEAKVACQPLFNEILQSFQRVQPN